MPSCRAAPAGGALLQLDADEAGVLRQLLGEMRELLEGGRTEDPVMSRLFPRAFEADEDESKWRELTGDDLLRQRLAAIDEARALLGSRGSADVELTGDGVGAWLALLTDLRLAIGTRLDVDEERMSADIDASDPDAAALSLVHWLGWIQELILRAVNPD